MTTDPRLPGSSAVSESRSGGPGALLVIGAGVAVAPLDSACNIAFPAMVAAFGRPVAATQWIVIAYVLTYASLLLGLGRLGDLVGHRRLFLAGLVWSAVALTLCALAPSFERLLAARVLQGVGAAMVLSSGPALATLSVPVARRAGALGAYMLAFSAAHAAGPLIGGPLIDVWGWPGVYWFRVPLALVSVALALRVLRPPPPSTPRERFDATGAAALTCGVACLLLYLNLSASLGAGSPVTLPVLLAGLAGAGAFVSRSRRSRSPLIELSLFRSREFFSVNAAHVLANLAHFVVFLLVPFYLLEVLAVSAAFGGVLLAQQPIGMALAAPLAGRLVPRLGAGPVGVAGVAVSAAGLGCIVSWDGSTPYAVLALTLLAQGFGHGLFQVASIDCVMAILGRERQGVGGSLNMLTRTTGVVMGATAGSMLLDHWAGADGTFLAGFQNTFVAAASVAVLALFCVALSLPRARRNLT